MNNKHGNKMSSIAALIESRKRSTKRRKTAIPVQSTKKRPPVWDGALTPSFLEHATNTIVSYNFEREIPIIYAMKGIIYKESKSGRIPIGKIAGIKRQINENNYTIEYIRKSE